MKIKANNNELHAVLTAIENYLEIVDDSFSVASLKSFVEKINGGCTSVNSSIEEQAIIILQGISEIEEFHKENGDSIQKGGGIKENAN